MAPSRWEDEDSEESTPPSSPPPTQVTARRPKFDDEEDESDVLESWDAEPDSEEERKKAAATAAAKKKAEEEAAKNKKSKAQRIEERRQENLRKRQEEEEDDSSDEEDEATKRARLKKTEQEADLKHAQDLFTDIGINNNRAAGKPVTVKLDASAPDKTVELSSLPLFNPQSRDQFVQLRETLVPLVGANSKKAQYPIFLQDFSKQLAKELSSDQVKKIASTLTALSNEKMKEEKAADKTGKKTKAQKAKNTLNAPRATMGPDINEYDGGLADDDFM